MDKENELFIHQLKEGTRYYYFIPGFLKNKFTEKKWDKITNFTKLKYDENLQVWKVKKTEEYRIKLKKIFIRLGYEVSIKNNLKQK